MTTTIDRRSKELEPNTLAFLEELEARRTPPIYTMTPRKARMTLLDMQKRSNVKQQPAEIEDGVITSDRAGRFAIRTVRPQHTAGLLPGVLYFHGGGWMLGDKETHNRLIREIANGGQVAVVFVDYARSPEAKYPIALEQGYEALEWVAEQGAKIGVDTSRLAVMGDSAGGNLATVVAMLAKERNGPQIGLQVLLYPVTDADLNTLSYRRYGNGRYWLSREGMKWFWDSYVDLSQRKKPTVSPLQASLEQLRGLPPALIITDENDVLRDEGEAYAHRLQEAGVLVVATRYLGTIHDFAMLNALVDTPPTRAAISQVNETLRTAFASDE